jgi:hypothetical protein
MSLQAVVQRRKWSEFRCLQVRNVCTVHNPRDTPIQAIRFELRSESMAVDLWLMNGEWPVEVRGYGLAPEERVWLRNASAQEVREIRSFYWWWIAAIDWLYRGRRGQVIMLAGLISALSLMTLADKHSPSGHGAVGQSDRSTQAGELEPISHLWSYVSVGLGSLLAVVGFIVLFYVLAKLFPRAVFLVREGTERYRQLVTLRVLFLTVAVLPAIKWLIFR